MPAIQDPAMVVCIDGPTRGRLRAVTGGERTRFHAYDMPLPPSLSENTTGWNEIIMPVLTYHVHTISFMGFYIRVASIQIDVDKIEPYDIITTLFNESARQATYRINAPTT